MSCQKMICRYFLPSVDCLFTFLMLSFKYNIYIFFWSPNITVFFTTRLLVLHLRNSCLFQHHKYVWRVFTWRIFYYFYTFSSVQSLSRVWLSVTSWTATHQASLSITNSQSLFKLRSIESVMPYNHLILCLPLLILPSAFLSIRVVSNE